MKDYHCCHRKNNRLRQQLMQPRRVDYIYLPLAKDNPNKEIDEGDLEKVPEVKD